MRVTGNRHRGDGTAKADIALSVITAYFDTVYRLAYAMMKNRSDADDIYQEVFLRYIRREPVFQSPEHARAWMLRVTVNCCKNHWKSPWVDGRMEPLEKRAGGAGSEGKRQRGRAGGGPGEIGTGELAERAAARRNRGTARKIPGSDPVVRMYFRACLQCGSLLCKQPPPLMERRRSWSRFISGK